MALINVNNASFGYDGKAVIQNISFSIQTGDYLCIVGDNGAGKSTLMKTVLGLIPIISGNIEFSDGLLQKEIGYLPQQTDIQKDFPASVKEVVLSGCLNRCGWRPYFNSIQKALALQNMERLGISTLSKRCYRELSGGQQQRVLLARALCATQRILLLDEPVAGLDPKATEELYSFILHLNKELGVTIVMISHDTKSAITYASKMLNIGNKSFFYGSTDEYIVYNKGKLLVESEEGDVQ